jgi:hypothetical protein
MRVVEVTENHIWKATPGCRILLLDGGAVRFDIPTTWTVVPREHHILLFDESPPNTRCSIGVSWHQLPLASEIPLSMLLDHAVSAENRRVIHRTEITHYVRPPLHVVWLQLRVFDASENCDMCTRMCIARSDGTIAPVLFEFRPEDELAVSPVWQTFLSTLAVGEFRIPAAAR